MSVLFSNFLSYDTFFDNTFAAPGVHKVGFIEMKDISASLESAFAKASPFSEMTIPPATRIRPVSYDNYEIMALRLGVMIAFFITAGIIGNEKVQI